MLSGSRGNSGPLLGRTDRLALPWRIVLELTGFRHIRGVTPEHAGVPRRVSKPFRQQENRALEVRGPSFPLPDADFLGWYLS